MKRGITIIAMTCLAGACAVAGQRMYLGDFYHPKVKAGEAPIRHVIVLPPSLQLTKSTMKGGESMEKEGEKITPVLDRAIIRSLRDAGVNVSDASPNEEMLAASPELRESVGNLQRSFDSISTPMLNRLKDVRKARFKVADGVSEAKWNEKEHSDTLVFVRGFGGRETKSKAFATGKGLLGAVLAGGLHLNVIMTFVDANSGEVLFVKAFMVGVHDDDTENKLVKDLERCLKANVKKGAFGTT